MDITSVLPSHYTNTDGLYVPPAKQDRTVWDTLSQNDLLDAATSAESEAHAIAKSRYQIEELKADANQGILLDLGCGYGRIAEQLLPERDFTAYVGVDSSFSMLNFAKDRKANLSVATPMYWVYGTIDSIPLQDNSVDTAVVSAVFLHNHKSITTAAIKELHRVLKPGGKLFVYSSFPSFHSLIGYQTMLYLWLSEFYKDPYRNGPVRHFSRTEVDSLLQDFSEVNIRAFGFTLLPKRILILPGFLQRPYLQYLANPINAWLEQVLSAGLQQKFPTHHDVAATK